jgi:hypothetical protein
VEFAGGTAQYGSFVIHRDTALVVRTADGRQERVRLYGSTLQRGGAFKVFSYAADD